MCRRYLHDKNYIFLKEIPLHHVHAAQLDPEPAGAKNVEGDPPAEPGCHQARVQDGQRQCRPGDAAEHGHGRTAEKSASAREPGVLL